MTAEPGPLPVPYHHGGPQIACGLEPTTVREGTATSAMRPGRWALDATGTVQAGALGVLMDDVTAYAALAVRPPRRWGVTSQLDVAFHAPVPHGTSRLTATAAAEHRDGDWAHAAGTVRAEGGTPVATVGQHYRYLPGDERAHRRPVTAEAVEPWLTSLDALLGPARTVPGPDGPAVRLEVAAHPGMTNPLGSLHGGIGLALCELGARRAHHTLQEEGGDTVRTSALHLTYLRPGRVEGVPWIAVRPVHTSRSSVLAEVQLYNGDGSVTIHAMSTLHRESTRR